MCLRLVQRPTVAGPSSSTTAAGSRPRTPATTSANPVAVCSSLTSVLRSARCARSSVVGPLAAPVEPVQTLGGLQHALDLLEEECRVPSVDQPVVVGEAEVELRT